MARDHGGRALAAGVILAAAAAVSAGAAGCLDPRDAPPRGTSGCASCHGSPERPGDPLVQAAPPFDVAGNRDVSYPGVGAHERHLLASPRHGAVACDTCHVVPAEVASPGHADDALPAEVALGGLARAGATDPEYDAARHRCASTYCHGASVPEWTHARAPEETCGSCHALPPPTPHPASESCERCHGEVIAADRSFVAPGKHVDGEVQVAFSCHACHGSEASDAPPVDLAGGAERSRPGVGAHQVHLAGGEASRPLACGECHAVPAAVGDPGHLDPAPAEVALTGVAATGGRAPAYGPEDLRCSNSWCHGPSSPAAPASPPWTTAASITCAGCHATPPPPPHPPMEDCSRCHGAVAGPGLSIAVREKHVDGTVQVEVPTACDACHGAGPQGAPPPGLGGESDPSKPGVGAHAIHLGGSAIGRAVPCVECHVVPRAVMDPGHLDSALPADLTFSGVALSWDAAPAYDGVTCSGSYCHGATFVAGHLSGGTLTQPQWLAGGTPQTYCGSCHGLPPPAPHPQTAQLCADCHSNILPTGEFVDPQTHVDGHVDLSPGP